MVCVLGSHLRRLDTLEFAFVAEPRSQRDKSCCPYPTLLGINRRNSHGEGYFNSAHRHQLGVTGENGINCTLVGSSGKFAVL